MFIEGLVNQAASGGWDFLWIAIPVFLCMLLMGQGRGSGGGSTAQETVTESWYTMQDTEMSYKTIDNTVAEWRKEAEEKKEGSRGILSSLRTAFGRGKTEERFVVKETIPPRLYRVSDASGPISFELTEVVGGGTVVQATFSFQLKNRMAKFKAGLPLKIPATPIGNRCPACGKPVLPEFNLCPYCEEKIIKG